MTEPADVEAAEESEPVWIPDAGLDPVPEAGYRYEGPRIRSYPHDRDPRTGYVLTAEPGDVIDFGEGSPPADGYWYDVASGLPYTGAATSSPASTGAGQEEGD